MSRFEKLACASMVALCLSGPSELRAGPDTRPIRVLCDDARLTAMCNEIARALANARPAHRVEVTEAKEASEDAHLTLRFVTARFTETMLAGHLVWQDAKGGSGTGTEIDLTVLDASIDDGMLRDYARQLLSFTDLPQ